MIVPNVASPMTGGTLRAVWIYAAFVAESLGQTLKHSRIANPVSLALCLMAAFLPFPSVADTDAGSGRASGPELKSNAFYILDEADSTVLAARNERVAAPIASISKLMTALVVLEAEQPMDEIIVLTKDDVAGTPGSRSRLPTGTKLRRSDLLHLALMSSENRAAHALCRSYPGGKPACVRAMNAKAKALGMKAARFVEPTGLSSANVASPRDLATLVRAASANPTIREYSTDPDHTVKVKGYDVEYRNTNLLVDKADWTVTVQKTGYIAKAGHCLVMETVIDGRNVVIVLLNSWGRLTRIGDANRVRAWMESSRLTST